MLQPNNCCRASDLRKATLPWPTCLSVSPPSPGQRVPAGTLTTQSPVMQPLQMKCRCWLHWELFLRSANIAKASVCAVVHAVILGVQPHLSKMPQAEREAAEGMPGGWIGPNGALAAKLLEAAVSRHCCLQGEVAWEWEEDELPRGKVEFAGGFE